MTTSEQINELASALAKAQVEMGHARKDSTNPHFRSQYADLQSVREAARPLAAHGIAVAQACRLSKLDDGQMVAEVETRFIHTSGQWMAETLAVPVSKPDAQGLGSALTYGRRYALAAFAGIAPADDDGEAAVGRAATQAPALAVPAGFQDWRDSLQDVAVDGLTALQEAWEASSKPHRAFLLATEKAWFEALKAKAKEQS